METIYANARERMVGQQLIPRGINDPMVLRAVRKVPRHRFVCKEMGQESYGDFPLPIGHHQTISQPYITALMIEALELKGGEKVLEIGTGSGYQAAILAEIAGSVYTVERYPGLMERASRIIADLGYCNVFAKADDGTRGWAEHQPFDAIVVTAGAPEIPLPLLEQLGEGGRLVLPVGGLVTQELVRVIRRGGRIRRESLGKCRFVPLRGLHGWK